MLIAVFIIAALYPALEAAFIGNSADPHNADRHALWMAKQLGTRYGIHAIWAWLLIALIDGQKHSLIQRRMSRLPCRCNKRLHASFFARRNFHAAGNVHGR
jgi:hypothetical protein